MSVPVETTTRAGTTEDGPPPARSARVVWRRLLADRPAVFGLAFAGLAVLVALTAPLLSALEGQDPVTFHPELVDSARGGVPLGSFGGVSAEHWLGVEPQTGRDLFARTVHGAQISLAVAVGAAVVQVGLGVALGLAAGLGGRWLDHLLGRVIDLVIAFPSLIFSVALLAVVPDSFPRPLLLMLILGLFGWGGTARIVRAQVLSLRSRDHVAAARLAGARPARVAFREILPGVVAPVLSYAAILLPSNMIAEAGLSFLGVGVRPPTPSWGQMLSKATTWFRGDPVYVLVPAILLFLTVLSFSLLADGLRTALDPRAGGLARRAE
ncbi:peptide/nickel transport system permease protein [Streptoalloteichus tenebrarius]|uniref:Peptide/nickel transport system permease protein n=1 Tax=Streptoalloteichus tenebrarius (strain ATCC 17920 / DSM 40477 / JCM 4838 / CBS 697.72 / NBRC 16177 / NCIMB 11028 / NRRL B-12390 / A12253. 1 / ISP 5477) TaxID=1933 RepID=A0ABT1HS57_STRSD|nr:ABC transporter permease [Streptoalloteichus tenebrarius]MCP2258346.1 peptide/nickel transport system permease protein [Streptoalloteichus tenebrarius]BFF03512.1 ABC transporter permease [Streptoalloteichus tenebrarius]